MKKWIRTFTIISVLLLILFGAATVIVDPYFHYHSPIDGMSYRLDDERYINDGISRHFEYDAIITGDSMTQNFKTTQFDELFGTKSIKIPYAGTSYKELWDAIDRALDRNADVKTVLVNIDGDSMAQEDYMRYESYPEYLYDDNPFNDLNYIWNKDIFMYGTLHNIRATLTGEASTTFDEYASWEHEKGYDKMMGSIERIDSPITQGTDFHDGRKYPVISNICNNVVAVTEKYPDTEFVIFVAPSSIAKWCELYEQEALYYRIKRYETALELLTAEGNIRVFGFQDCFDIVDNPDLYSDAVHYDSQINERILQMIHDGEHELTKDNYMDYINSLHEYYENYDYVELCHRKSEN